VKYLIVNADDFGAGRGINRAIQELHERGIVTSASLMIDMPAAPEAVAWAKAAERLGVGLHVALTDEDAVPLVDFDDKTACFEAICSQIERFDRAVGHLPTHLDSHQNVHRDERLRPLFIELAKRYGLPLREHSVVRYFPDFYGQWDGEPHPEQIGIENLLAMLASQLSDGITELSCHPGYRASDFTSPYDAERAIELQTLSDPRFLKFLGTHEIKLINFKDVGEVLHAV
jgi:predicted glycoside hydrolase/deacetylase ChbG (UPF0249 family)